MRLEPSLSQNSLSGLLAGKGSKENAEATVAWGSSLSLKDADNTPGPSFGDPRGEGMDSREPIQRVNGDIEAYNPWRLKEGQQWEEEKFYPSACVWQSSSTPNLHSPGL